MLKKIYVIRHAQAEGQAPSAKLTAAGARQAGKLAEFFAGKPIDAIISSPYERAYQTIKPLADKLGTAVALDERLAERVLSGTSHPEWRDRLRRAYDDLDLAYEGGEASRAAMSRAAAVVGEILRSSYTNAAIVSHGNLISLLLKHYDSRFGFREWEALSNPDVYLLSFENGAEAAPVIQRLWTE